MVNSLLTNTAKKVLIHRYGNSSPSYSIPASFQVGTNNNAVTATSSSLTNPIPINNGTVLEDGSNNFTGSSGGDNSTDNTSTFKPGAGVSDDTAQNLIANNTSTSKVWTITLTTNATEDDYTGCWLYIKDSTALDKFADTGTALEIRVGSDSSNYYSLSFEDDDLSTGWNWLNLGVLNTNTETGTVSGNIDTLVVVITTNNATDEFIAGDVVFDLLRQWDESDTIKTLSTITVDEDNYEIQQTGIVTATEANGYEVDSHLTINSDSPVKALDIAKFTEESKSSTDIFTITVVNRII